MFSLSWIVWSEDESSIHDSYFKVPETVGCGEGSHVLSRERKKKKTLNVYNRMNPTKGTQVGGVKWGDGLNLPPKIRSWMSHCVPQPNFTHKSFGWSEAKIENTFSKCLQRDWVWSPIFTKWTFEQNIVTPFVYRS